MRFALLVTACACVAASSPAQAGGIGGAAQNACAITHSTLPMLGVIPVAGPLLSNIANLAHVATGAIFQATVVDSQKLGAGYSAGDQVNITVTGPCRFSISPAAKGKAPPGRQTLEFEIDDKGRALSREGSARKHPGRTHEK